MSRAVWQLGQAVRECGIALERAGARLSTDYSFTEPRECSLCSFPPPCPSNPPPVVLGALPKVPARGSAEPGRVCVRARREGCTLSSIIVPRVRGRAAGSRQGRGARFAARWANAESGVARLPAAAARNGGRGAAQQAGHSEHCACWVLALAPIRRALRGGQDA